MTKEGSAASRLPSATVVVLAWKWSEDLADALAALSHQTTDDFEILVVDNGAGFEAELLKRPNTPAHSYLKLPTNVGASAGRNAALTSARSRILIFLDDDSTPEPGVVAAHLAAYERPGVVATRGRAIPRTDRFLSRVGFNYDLGAEPAPAFLNAENNCSILRSVFEDSGGFATDLFGHEGNELSLRLIDRYGADCIWYVPEAVVRHDDYDSVPHYFKKNFRMGAMAARIDLRRVRALRPPALARPRDSLSLPLRLAGKVSELTGFALARLTGTRPRPARPALSAARAGNVARFGSLRQIPVASVVVVAWKWTDGLTACLDGLATGNRQPFEVVVVDNGAGLAERIGARSDPFPIALVQRASNGGASVGRNAGAAEALGEIVVFLDDDAAPAPGFVDAHIQSFTDPAVVAVRGRIRPRSDAFLNRLDVIYDLGDRPVAAILNVEGNSSIRTSALTEVGGFDESLFGHEGMDLSLRLLDRFGPGSIMYAPEAVAYHDFAESFGAYLRRSYRHGRMAGRVDMSRIRQVRPHTISRKPDPVAFALRHIGQTLEGFGRLASRLVGPPPPRMRTYS